MVDTFARIRKIAPATARAVMNKPDQMTERLKLVDGQLVIDSKPQYGTTVHARVPHNGKVKSALAAS